MESEQLVTIKTLNQSARNQSIEPIEAKPNVLFAVCCAPCAITCHPTYEKQTMDILISAVICFTIPVFNCCFGYVWSQRPDVEAAGAPYIAEMKR
jgi:hypothetical protein